MADYRASKRPSRRGPSIVSEDGPVLGMVKLGAYLLGALSAVVFSIISIYSLVNRQSGDSEYVKKLELAYAAEVSRAQAATADFDRRLKKADAEGFARGQSSNAAAIDSLKRQVAALQSERDALVKQISDCKSAARR